MNWDDELEALFSDPMFSDVRPPAPKQTEGDRLTQSFDKINAFYESNGKEPQLDALSIDERMLAHTLKSLRENKGKYNRLTSKDKYGLLSPRLVVNEKAVSERVEDELESLFDDPLLEITDDELSIFYVPESLKKNSEKAEADFVAQREVCDTFYLYEVGFEKVHQELKEGKRSLAKLKAQALKEGTYYVVSGVMVYLDKIIDPIKNSKHELDGRTHCVYENGTESNIMLATLRKAVYMDGYMVKESQDSDEETFQKNFAITPNDIPDGWIYVLRSLSANPQIMVQSDLYKIGFSTTPVEQRIENAQNDPTYLMAKVEIIATWKTFNMKTHQFEKIIHQFFSTVQYRVKVQNAMGDVFTPHEWYVAPLSIIENVVEKIIDRTIVNYRYNSQLQVLEEIQAKQEQVNSNSINTTGWAILTLNIKKVWFDMILSGEKTIEYRDLKSSKLNTYTWVDNDGKRYLRKFDAIRFYVGYHGDQDSALVEVKETIYNSDARQAEYYLGKVLEAKSTKN